jgi:single-strand DNA-binding protein
MAGVNKVILVGNLGRDPEARSMNNGGEVVSFSVATSETWNDKQSGERKEKTEWHNVVIFNENLGRVAKQYLRKGSTCYLEGAMQTRKYTDRDGHEKSITEVVLQRFRGELVLLGGRGGEGGGQGGGGGGSYGGGQSRGGGAGGAGGGDWGGDSGASQFGGGGSGGSGTPRGGGSPFDSDLDDDVPF